MLYLTIIGIVCAAVAPVGTLEFGFKDRISNRVNCQDADHVHIERRPGNTTEAFDKAESTSGIRYTNTEVDRSGRRKLLEIDAFELDLSYDLEESGEMEKTRTSPTTKKPWKRKRSAKTNLNDVTADAEIDMNKRIEKLARECSLHGGDVEDTLKSPLTDEVTELPPVDGLQEVLDIFSGRDKEKRLWLNKREINLNGLESKRIPRRRRRRRRRRKRRRHRFNRDEVATSVTMKLTTNGEHVDETVRMPWHVRGKPLGYMKSHKLLKSSFAPKPRPEFENHFNLDKFEATVKDLFRNSGISQSTEESTVSTECTTYMGVFERKMKEFREHQKLSSTRFSCTPSVTDKDCKVTTPEPPNSCVTFEDSSTVGATYELPSGGDLSPDRYLKIRHALRNYLIKTNVLSPKVQKYHWHRKRRCNKPSCFMRKCKKAPPLVCLPFIKRGQDDMIKFIINVLQSMLDKSANSKRPYSLTKLKYKALKNEDSWESVESEIVSSCESGTSTRCQKGTTSPVYAPPVALLPFQFAYPPCECPISTCPPTVVLPSPFCMTTPPPPTCPPTCPPAPTCPPTCPPTYFPTTTPLPLPPPTPMSTIACTEPPCSSKQVTRPCLSFDPITQPAVIIPTFFPPWPTTQVDSIVDPCRHAVATDRNIGGSCCLETFQPWPTTSRSKSTPCKNCMKNYRFQMGKSHEFNYNLADQAPLDRFLDSIDYPYPNANSQNTFMNPDESKVNRFDFESVYDSPGQETVEEAQIDVRSHIFDYDPSNSFDLPGQSFEAPGYDIPTQPMEHMKMNVNAGPYFRRHKYPRRLSKRLKKMKDDEMNREEHDIQQDYMNDYMSSRQKRDEITDKESTEELNAQSSTKSSNTLINGGKSLTNTTEASSNSTTDMSALISGSSNYRGRYESYSQEKNEDKRLTTLKSAAIVRGPKRLSNHPQAKVFPKVFPESYPHNSVDTSTVKPEKTTQATGNGNSSFMHLQLLAVCEGYLEMIKLLKINNHTNDDGLDAELIRYCESEISKSFDSSRESWKSKKSLKTTTLAELGTPTESGIGQMESPVSKRNLRNKVVVDILGSPIYKEMRAHSLSKNNNRYNSGASSGDFRRKRRRRKRRGHRNRLFRRRRRKKGDNEDSVRLLRKKKGALASWLFNKREKETQENEYIDDSEGDEDVAERTNTETVSSSSTSSSVRRKGISTEMTTSLETVYPIYAKNYGYDKGGELGEIEILWKALNERNETKGVVKNMTVLAMLMNPEEEERDVQLVEESDEIKSDTEKLEGKPRVKFESDAEAPKKRENGTVSLFPGEDVVNEMVEEDTTTSEEISSDLETTLLGHVTTTELATTKHKNNTGNGTYAHAVSTAKELVKDYTIEFLNYAVYIIPTMFILLFFVCCVCFILKIMIHNRKKRKNKNKKANNKKKKVVVPPSSETETETSESSLLEARKKQKPKKMETLKHKSKKFWSAFTSRNKGESDEEDDTDEEKNNSRDKKFLKFLRKEKRQKQDEGDDSEEDNENKYLRKLKRKKNMDMDYYDNEVRSPVSEKKRVSYKNDSSYGGKREESRIQRSRDAAAKERRELIALLEELKHMEKEDGRGSPNADKKEYKSVFVQYMTHEEDKENQTGGFQKFDDGSQKSHYNFGALRSDNLSIDGMKNLQFDKFSRNIDYRIGEGYEGKFCDRGVGTQPGRKRLLSGDVRRDLGGGDDVLENFRRLSKDMGAELLKGNARDIAYKFDLLTRMINHLPIGSVSPRKKSILLEELENFRRHVGCRKDIRLKDDGVLCRL